MAKTVRVQARTAEVTAAGKLSGACDRIWLKPEMHDAAPKTPASKANITKNPVAALPIGKNMGAKCAGRCNPGPVGDLLIILANITNDTRTCMYLSLIHI